MSAGEFAALLAAVLASLAFAAVCVALVSLVRVLGEVRAGLAEMAEQTGVLVAELREAVSDAERQLRRADRLVGSAEGISATLSSTSRLASGALAAPVIKTVALASGASEAGKRLRRRPGAKGGRRGDNGRGPEGGGR